MPQMRRVDRADLLGCEPGSPCGREAIENEGIELLVG